MGARLVYFVRVENLQSRDPQGPDSGLLKVNKGGSYLSSKNISALLLEGPIVLLPALKILVFAVRKVPIKNQNKISGERSEKHYKTCSPS